MTGRALVALVLGLAGLAGPARAEAEMSKDDQAAALAASRAAVGRSVADQTFRDVRGGRVRLADYAGKPLVVSLIYTGCSHTCPLIVQRLAQATEVAQGLFGAGAFAVVTVGFDVRNDTPERMRAFARGQGIDLKGWEFVSGDARSVGRLAEDLGFVFVPSAKGFDHLAQTTVIDAEGRVFRQILGDEFEPPALVEPLKQLIYGRAANFTTVEGLANRLRLFCSIYDPSQERYRFDWSVFIGTAIGFLSLVGVGVVLVRAWRESRRHAAGTESA